MTSFNRIWNTKSRHIFSEWAWRGRIWWNWNRDLLFIW